MSDSKACDEYEVEHDEVKDDPDKEVTQSYLDAYEACADAILE